MKTILTFLSLAILAASAIGEPATIYGILTRHNAKGTDYPNGDFTWYTVKPKCPVTVEMESYEQDEEGRPPVLVRVITNEIQIAAEIDASLVGKMVRVEGETFAPDNWHHQTPVLLLVEPEKGGSIREPAPLAPKGSNERGKPL